MEGLSVETCRFYRHAIDILNAAQVPFLVGGAYAFGSYTKIIRHTKDFDLFLATEHVETALQGFRDAGYDAKIVFTHWLGKAYHGEDFVDLIYSSGNSVCPVDPTWFANAVDAKVLGKPVKLVPAEEMIWQKAFIMERERFDGADVNHLIRARSPHMDWDRLLARFDKNWRVLFSHLVLFGFVYPEERDLIPNWVVHTLSARLLGEGRAKRNGQICHGPLLSRMQYLADTEKWGYKDPRLAPHGTMTADQLDTWTEAGRTETAAR